VGEHTGAAIAAEVAIDHPERVRKLVVSGYPLFTDEELATRRQGKVPDHSRRIEPLVLQGDGGHLGTAWNHARDGLRIQDRPLSEIHAVTMAILQSGARNVEAHLALWQYDPTERLPQITVPTLVLMTTEDQFCDRGETVRQLIPGSRLQVIRDGGFYAPHHAPRPFARAIT
jgi:pimeloyl-ACP methyl ester carboxylesterase